MSNRNENGPRRSMFAASLAIHVVLVAALPVLLMKFGGTDEPEKIEVVFYSRDELPPPPAPPEIQEVQPEPMMIEPPVVAEAAPKPESRPVVAQVQPRPVAAPRPKAATPQRPRPQPPQRTVQTNVFRQAEATAAAEPRKQPTRTGSFGDTEIAAVSAPGSANLRASARVGGFQTDPTPATPEAERPERRTIQTSFGGSEAAPQGTGAPARQRSTVQQGGFGDTANPTPASTGAKPGSVATGGFGEAVVAPAPRRARSAPAANPDTPVEILSKPKPVYTPEARAARVEGEVVIKVTFDADGELRILDVLEGLGHGLDEAAVKAAREIEFKPARRNGQPVDHTAVVRIVFQLA